MHEPLGKDASPIEKLFGGIYDDRFSVKDAETLRAVLATYEVPYKGVSPTLLVDAEDVFAVAAVVSRMSPELPERKRQRK